MVTSEAVQTSYSLSLITSLSRLVCSFSARIPQNKNSHRSEKHNFCTWGWKNILRKALNSKKDCHCDSVFLICSLYNLLKFSVIYFIYSVHRYGRKRRGKNAFFKINMNNPLHQRSLMFDTSVPTFYSIVVSLTQLFEILMSRVQLIFALI